MLNELAIEKHIAQIEEENAKIYAMRAQMLAVEAIYDRQLARGLIRKYPIRIRRLKRERQQLGMRLIENAQLIDYIQTERAMP